MTEPSEPSGSLKVLAGRIVVGLSAVTAFAFFALVVGPGILRQRDQPDGSSSATESVKGSTGWLDPAESPARKGRVLPPIDPEAVLTPRPPLLERGKSLYAQNCVSCHGEHGRGDGPAASTLNPRPRDLTRPEGWTNGYRITEIFKTLSSGIKGTGMAAFDYLPLTDRMALVHAVRSFGSFQHGPEDPAALGELRARLAQTGGKIPNRIPVSLAISKLAAEAPATAPLPTPADAAARALLGRAVQDPERAARTLAGLSGKSEVELATILSSGAPANGFSPAIAKLRETDWQVLRSVLLRARGAEPEG